MRILNTLFSSGKLVKEPLKISNYFLMSLIFVLGSNYSPLTPKALFAQISTQKVSPVRPAEQPKQLQTQPKPQFQVSSSIKVIYPNGGEVWEEGKTYTIRWTSENVRGNVQIQLLWSMTGPGGLHTINNVANTGSYKFTVPKLSDLAEITPYLLISTMDGKVKDASDNVFSIRKPFVSEMYNVYVGEHPKARKIDWSDEAQGIAHDKDHWYITQKGTIWKIPVSVDLSDARRTSPGVRVIDLRDIPQLQGYNHFGDLDYYEFKGQGYLLIPIDGEGWGDKISSVKVIPPAGMVSPDYPILYEHANFKGKPLPLRTTIQNLSSYGFNDIASSIWIPNGWTVEMYEHADFKGASLRKTASVSNLHAEIKIPAVIAAFDAVTLGYVNHTTLGTPSASWCAIDSQGILYMSTSGVTVLRFMVHWETLRRDRKLNLGSLSPILLQDEFGKQVFIDTPQGGAISPVWNLLYLVAGYSEGSHPSWGINVFDLRTGRRIGRSQNGEGPFNYEFHPGWSSYEAKYEEPEGMTIWDLDDGRAPGITGKLHVLMLDNDPRQDDIYLKHYTTSTAYPVLYEHANFGGKPFPLRTTLQNLSSYGFNDIASSIWVPNGWTVEMYEHADFKGASLRKTASVSNLHPEGWGDRISSVRVFPPTAR